MSIATRIVSVLTLSAFVASGCAFDDVDLDAELVDSESIAIETEPDGKADAIGVKNFKVVGKGDSFLVVGYDSWGREITRMYGGTDGDTSWATLYGYGTSLTIDLTKKKWSYTEVVTGKVAGSAYSIYANSSLSSVSKYGAAPSLSKGQAQLIQTWEWLAPEVVARTKSDVVKACLAAVAEAVIRIAICVGSGGFWDCIGAVSSVIDAVSTCREAID